MTIHQRKHPNLDVEGCFGCHAATVSFYGCTPTRSIGAGQQDRTRSKKWESRIDAYKDLRRQGVQPEGTKWSDIRNASDASDKYGFAFNADKGDVLVNDKAGRA